MQSTKDENEQFSDEGLTNGEWKKQITTRGTDLKHAHCKVHVFSVTQSSAQVSGIGFSQCFKNLVKKRQMYL